LLEHILSTLIKAGWVIIPLVLTSVLGWYVAFQRFMALSRMSWNSKNKWDKSLREGNWAAYLHKLSNRKAAGRPEGILKQIYGERFGGRPGMEAKLDEQMKFFIPELEKGLSTLAILASAAPLMGLLGTVSGMVRTFQVISAFGTGNQALMSDSISESLMATQNGLLIAFPLMLMHVFLSAKAEALEKETLGSVNRVINSCVAVEIRDDGDGAWDMSKSNRSYA